ncbi:unnamed protein product [Orchesella dallaii]|uniref:Uncharacterized protein n=1 Tax=Orchesella dallaii TaxID=48710 RepID=A0ABP1QXK3_9HEXA
MNGIKTPFFSPLDISSSPPSPRPESILPNGLRKEHGTAQAMKLVSDIFFGITVKLAISKGNKADVEDFG